ncbi:MAG: hypothetical protein V4670_11075 [Bacteroidota bacterium]
MRTYFRHIVSFAGGFLFLVFALEGFLILSEIKLPFKTLDEKTGKTYQSSIPIHEAKEGFYMGETNAYGFVGNVSKKKPKNVFRIALLGDSFTEGFQLFAPFHFSKILEQSLNKHSKDSIEVLNFGMSNVVLPEMYIRKKTLADQFDIDLFVYVLDSYDFIYQPEGVLSSVELRDHNGKLTITTSNSKGYQVYKKIKPLVDQSSYINFLFDGYLMVRRQQAFPIIFDKFYPKSTASAYQAIPTSEVFNHISDQYFKIVSEMEKDNTVFVFREEADAILKSKLKPYRIPVIETKQALDEVRARGINPYYWGLNQTIGHFNYEGNATFGKYLAKELAPYLN